MTEMNRILLAGTNANATGIPYYQTGQQVSTCFEISCDVTAASLVAEVNFTAGLEDAAVLPNLMNAFVQTTVAPTGVTFVANPGGGQGHVRFGAGGVFPAVGRSSIVLRLSLACRFVKPVYTYTSGGGDVVVKVIGWGAIVGQEP